MPARSCTWSYSYGVGNAVFRGRECQGCRITVRAVFASCAGGGWHDSFTASILGGKQGPACPKTLDTAEAGLDEGLLSLFLPHSCLYVE
jgi:hypothetical protein